MRRRSTLWFIAVLVLGASMASAQDPAFTPPRLGVSLASGASADGLPVASTQGAAAPWVRILASWPRIDGETGDLDWASVESDIAAAGRSGFRVALVLGTSHPGRLPGGGVPRVEVAGSLESFERFARGAVARFGDRIDVLQVGERLPPTGDADRYAFFLKNAVLAISAEAQNRKVELSIAQAAVRSDRLDVQRALWTRGAAAYVDVLPVEVDAARADEETATIAALLAETLQHPPASRVWALAGGGNGDPSRRPALAIRALAAGAEVALVEPGSTDLATLADWVDRAHALLASGYAPAPLGAPTLEERPGEAPGEVLGRFLRESDFTAILFYRLPGERDGAPSDRLVVDSSFVRQTQVIDLNTADRLRVSSQPLGGGARGRSVRVYRGRLPLALQFEQAPPPDQADLPPEQLETRRTRELTAQEIISRHQRIAEAQSDRLERWIADARIDLHFRLAQGGGTVDLSIASTYYWQRGMPLEWEQTQFYVNGNAVRWKNIPEFPNIQPEKVVTLPLDLSLDKTYDYRSAGRARVRGREAYVLVFQPVDPDAPRSLYRGRLWIDAETFELLRTSVVQTGLDAPVLSNEEVDDFGRRSDATGREFQLIEESDGQQTWTVSGRTFVVKREVYFDTYTINPPQAEFDRRKQTAYDSNNKVLRDTDDGFRYMRKQKDGTRKLATDVDTDQLFVAAGAFSDTTGNVVPAAGVNYFNYDLFGKNIQTNVFFAGAFLFGTLSKPDLFDGKADLTLDVSGLAIEFEERLFAEDVEVEADSVDRRPQSIRGRLGFPFGKFFKLNAIAGVTYREFSPSDTSDEAIDRFNTAELGDDPDNPPIGARTLSQVIPVDHFEARGVMELEFNRRGLSVIAEAGYFERSDFEEFGLFVTPVADPDAAPTFVRFDPGADDFVAGTSEPVRDSFTRWNVTVFKEWYFKRFQKMRVGLDYLDGSGYDRFSRYQFGFFGDDRVWGFSGSGIRFDEGVIGRLGYTFNLFEVIQFSAAVDHARVENEFFDSGTQAFTGVGFTANFVGPWQTVFNINYGYAVDSDIPDLEGEQEFLFTVFKLF